MNLGFDSRSQALQSVIHVPDFSALRVLVVGDVMLDQYIWGDTHRISPEAPVPVVAVQRDSNTAGGAANVALNLAALGVDCEVFGRFGTDQEGDTLVALLRDRGVKVQDALRQPGERTITKTRVMVRYQQICRLDREPDPSVSAMDTDEKLQCLEAMASDVDAIIVSDYAKGVVTQKMLAQLSQYREGRTFVLAADPKPLRQLRYKGFDLLTPNRTEAYQLANLPPPHHVPFDVQQVCARIMEQHGPRLLVVTLGEDGMVLYPREGSHATFPTVARDVADVSGAGDTVVATLVAGLASGLPEEQVVRLANAAAGIVVSKLGTAVVSRPELEQAINPTGVVTG